MSFHIDIPHIILGLTTLHLHSAYMFMDSINNKILPFIYLSNFALTG